MTSNKELVMKTVTAHPEASGFRGLTGEPRNAEDLVYELQNTVTCAYWTMHMVDQGLIEGEDDVATAVQAATGVLERAAHLLQNAKW